MYLLYFLDGDQEAAKLAELLHVDQLKRDETSPALAIDTRPIRGPVGYLVCLSVSWAVCLSLCLSPSLSVCLSVCQSLS